MQVRWLTISHLERRDGHTPHVHLHTRAHTSGIRSDQASSDGTQYACNEYTVRRRAYLGIILQAADEFWCHPVRRANHTLAFVLLLRQADSETKVRDLNCATEVYQNVVRLDVAVQAVLAVQVRETHENGLAHIAANDDGSGAHTPTPHVVCTSCTQYAVPGTG